MILSNITFSLGRNEKAETAKVRGQWAVDERGARSTGIVGTVPAGKEIVRNKAISDGTDPFSKH